MHHDVFMTPFCGRSVINRFSKDVGTLDDIIPLTICIQFLYSSITFMYTLIYAIISQWIVNFPSLIFIIILLLYRSYYLRISRQVKANGISSKESHLNSHLHNSAWPPVHAHAPVGICSHSQVLLLPTSSLSCLDYRSNASLLVRVED